MISDYDLFVNKFISVPRDMGALNCAAFIAGIVKGALDGGGFPARCASAGISISSMLARSLSLGCSAILKPQCFIACRVTAHFVPVKGQAKPKTTILMKFEPLVLQRERRSPTS